MRKIDTLLYAVLWIPFAIYWVLLGILTVALLVLDITLYAFTQGYSHRVFNWLFSYLVVPLVAMDEYAVRSLY